MSDAGSVVSFLSEPSTLLALSAVAVGTAWYLSRGTPGVKSLVPLDNQSLEVPVSPPRPAARGGAVVKGYHM